MRGRGAARAGDGSARMPRVVWIGRNSVPATICEGQGLFGTPGTHEARHFGGREPRQSRSRNARTTPAPFSARHGVARMAFVQGKELPITCLRSRGVPGCVVPTCLRLCLFYKSLRIVRWKVNWSTWSRSTSDTHDLSGLLPLRFRNEQLEELSLDDGGNTFSL